MEYYNFYFDETYHTRKITYRNGKLNLDNDKDFYVGCYIGAKDWEHLQNQLLAFETRQKQKLGISPDKELKSTSLINSNKITYGIHSLNAYAIDFYTELFEILKGNIKIHLYIMNKYEFLFHNIFPGPKFFIERGVIYKNFMYCLTKFVVLHPQYKICDILLSPQKDRQKRRQIITILKKHLRKIENIQKKRGEKEAVSMLINIFHAIPFRFQCAETIAWDYRTSPSLFEEFLLEQNIGIQNLYIDNEANTVEAAGARFGDAVSAVQSEDTIQIRVCDWVACLVSRLVLSHEKSYMQELPDNEFTENLHLLDDQYFVLNTKQQNLVELVWHVMLEQQEGYWSTAGSAYNDATVSFYTFIRYCHFQFENNQSLTPIEFNSWLIQEFAYMYEHF